MSPKCERICARLRACRRHAPPPKRAHAVTPYSLYRARERHARLESEREQWERLVRACNGSVTRIAARMGCLHTTARDALWDLGLWPAVVRERGGGR